MTSLPTHRNAFRTGLIVRTVVAGLLFGSLLGCDAQIQTTVWTGLNTLTVSLVNVLFQVYKPNTTSTTPVTVSWLDSPATAPFA